MKKKLTKKSNTSVSRIGQVNPSKEFNISTDSKWTPILKTFNPFGAIAEAYVKTLAYKLETKRLNLEIVRINKQAKIAHKIIDRTFELKKEELKHRRDALIFFYDTLNKELENLFIERKTVLKMAMRAQKQTFRTGLSIEERQMYKEMAIEMTKTVSLFGASSNEALKNLVDALPPIEISARLLED